MSVNKKRKLDGECVKDVKCEKEHDLKALSFEDRMKALIVLRADCEAKSKLLKEMEQKQDVERSGLFIEWKRNRTSFATTSTTRSMTRCCCSSDEKGQSAKSG